MTILRIAIAVAFLAYFLNKARRQRVFLLGIPFLMFMNHSVFFNYLKPFWMPGRWWIATHVMVWLFLAWLLCIDLLVPSGRPAGRLRAPFGPRLVMPEEGIILAIGGLVAVEIAITAVRYTDLVSALGQATGLIYLLVGYLLVRGIVCNAQRSDLIELLGALVVVNTVAAVFYIIHQGFQVTIYQVTEYLTFFFRGEELTRSFYFMPQLLPLALAFVLARRAWNLGSLLVVLLSLIALWVSYTRSLVAIALIEIAIVLGIRMLKGGQASLATRRLGSILLVGAAVGVLAYLFLPTQSQYFFERIGVISKTGVIGEPNLVVRQNKVLSAYEWTTPGGHLLGAGFVSPTQDAHVVRIDKMSPDGVWIPIVFRLGLVGVALFGALSVVACARAASLAFSGSGDAEFMAIVLACVLITLFIQGFLAWTFMDPWRYPMGLWPFAFLVSEASARRAETKLTTVLPG